MINLLLAFFSIISIISAYMIILSVNSVYSILYMLLVFLSSSSILFLLECEFIALMFLIVYIGAIAILFLFIVMMLDLKFATIKTSIFKYVPFAFIVGIVLLFEILNIIYQNFTFTPYVNSEIFNNNYINWFDKIDYITELEAVGQVLYTHYVLQFLIAGYILLLAVLCPVILVLNTNKQVQSQIFFKQLSRNYKNAIIKIN